MPSAFHADRSVRLNVLTSSVIAVCLCALVGHTSICAAQHREEKPVIKGPAPFPFAHNFNIDGEVLTDYGSYSNDALENPNVDAVNINMDWAAVEPRPDKYNFAPADAEAAAWAAKKKKFVIVVRYTNEHPGRCTKPQRLPAWEVSRIPTFCDAVPGNTIPDYFDPTFKADLKKFIQAVADHFASGPSRSNLLYARVGLGLGSETFYLTPCRANMPERPCDFESAKERLVAWGWSPHAWESWQREMLAFAKQAFSYTTVIYPIVRLDNNPDTGKSIEADVAAWAVANGTGLGAEGLGPKFGNGPAQIGATFKGVHAASPSSYLQLQTVRPVPDRDTLQTDINLATRFGAQFIEWYTSDIIKPDYQELLAKWHAAH